MKFLKSPKNHFPPGPSPRGAIFPKNGVKKILKILKNPQNPLTLIPPGGPYYIFFCGWVMVEWGVVWCGWVGESCMFDKHA